MALNLTQRLVRSHPARRDLTPGAEIALRIDHSRVQDDHLDADEPMFEPIFEPILLRSACRRFGGWCSRPGTGRPVHGQSFGTPGLTPVGSDSHNPAAGSLGRLRHGPSPRRIEIPRTGGAIDRLRGRLTGGSGREPARTVA